MVQPAATRMCLPRWMPWPDSSVPNEPMRVSSSMTMSPIPPTKRITTKDSSRHFGPTSSRLPRTDGKIFTSGSTRAESWICTASSGATSPGLVMMDGPVIGNVVIEWIEPGAQRGVVRMRAAISDDGIGVAHAFEAGPDAGWNHYQRVVVGTEKHFLALAGRAGICPFVEQRQLDAPLDAGIVQRHLTVLVPALHHVLVDGGEVNLPELAEVRVGAL